MRKYLTLNFDIGSFNFLVIVFTNHHFISRSKPTSPDFQKTESRTSTRRAKGGERSSSFIRILLKMAR